MKKTIAVPLLAAATISALADTPSTNKSFKVFSIGNSFSSNAHALLPEITSSMGDGIVLGHVAIGGCCIERHWRNAAADHESYEHNKEPISLENYLKAEEWDYVTIQFGFPDETKQPITASTWTAESFEPHGANLIAFIREHAPQAEILVHQTWAFRQDNTRLQRWGVTTDEMHELVAKTYRAFALRHGLRVIPAGDAFQLARREYGWDDYTPENKETGEPAKGKSLLGDDGYHASSHGQYLLGCVWYEFLYGKDVRPSKYKPLHITQEQAEQIREIAHKTDRDNN